MKNKEFSFHPRTTLIMAYVNRKIENLDLLRQGTRRAILQKVKGL